MSLERKSYQQNEFQSFKRNSEVNSPLKQTLNPQFTLTQTIDGNDETEQEAIELIKNQVMQIKTLKEEIKYKDETIENLKIQTKQIEAYKNQISNLKHQIQLFEERFKYFEDEKTDQERKILEYSRDDDQKQKGYQREIDDLNQCLLQYRRQIEEDNIRLSTMQQTIDQKERLYLHIKDQVESLAKQMESLQMNMSEREEESQQKINILKKESKLHLKEKKMLEQRIKELSEIIQNKYQENLNQSKMTQDKDGVIKKLKSDIERIKRERDDQKRQKEMIEQKMPDIEKNMQDLNQVVEKCNADFQKELAKKDALIKENADLLIRIQEFQHIYQDLEITDPKQFRQDLELTKQEVQTLRQDLIQKQKILTQKEDILNLKEEEFRVSKENILSVIQNVIKWIQQNFDTQILFKEDLDEDEHQYILKINDQLDPLIYQQFQKLTQQLYSSKGLLKIRFQKLKQRQESLQNELKQANNLKKDIVEDFKRLKSSIMQNDSVVTTINSENDSLRRDIESLRDQLQLTKEQLFNVEQDQSRFLIEMYNQLLNIRHKYESNDKITQQLNLELKHQFTIDKHLSIIELANMIGDITNILNFEIKNIAIKESHYNDLYSAYEDLKSQSVKEIQDLEEQRKKELLELQQNFEKKYQRFKEYQIDIERINQELQAQLKRSKDEFFISEQEQNKLRLQLDEKHQINETSKQELNSYQINLPRILDRIDDLIFQKNILKKELKMVSSQYNNTQKALLYLTRKFQDQLVGQEALQEHQQNMKTNQSFKSNGRYQKNSSPYKREQSQLKSLQFPTQCLKLRKYVLAVIMIRRLLSLKVKQLQNQNIPRTLTNEMICQQIDNYKKYFITPPHENILQTLTNYISNKQLIVKQQNKMNGNLYSQYKGQNLIQTLNIGTKNIKHLVTTNCQEQIEFTQLNKDLQYLFFIFKPKEFLNRNLLSLEKIVDKQRASALLIQQNVFAFEQENKILNEKLYQSQQELIMAYTNCEKYALQIQEMQVELQEVVSKEEYDRVKSSYEQINDEFFNTKDSLRRIEDKLNKIARERDELVLEKKEIFQNIIKLESQLSDKERELELKEVKIQSLENIISKREHMIEYNNNMVKFEEKIRGLEQDKENLIKDNIALIKENEYLQQQINTTFREEQEKLQQYHHERAQKQNEIQKLLEANLQTLEQRSQFLEQQVFQLKAEKEELLKKGKTSHYHDLYKENDALISNKEQSLSGTMKSPTFQNLFLDSGVQGEFNQKYQTFQNTANLAIGSQFKQNTKEDVFTNFANSQQITNQNSGDKIPGKITKLK